MAVVMDIDAAASKLAAIVDRIERLRRLGGIPTDNEDPTSRLSTWRSRRRTPPAAGRLRRR
jgi:hypothetical protein